MECIQILNALLGYKDGWTNHPATRMWTGYEIALTEYAMCMCDAWITRGFQDTCWQKLYMLRPQGELVLPDWWNDNRVLLSHRSNLLRKDFRFYSQYKWEVEPNLPYYWPK